MTVVLSSESLAWPDVVAELHRSGPGRAELESATHHEVSMHVGRAHPLWERFDGRAKEAPHRAGDLLVIAAGERRELAWNRPTAFFRVRLRSSYVRAVAESLDHHPGAVRGAPVGRFPNMERVLVALRTELERGTASDGLVVEGLAARLAVALMGPRVRTTEPRTLAPRQLQRVVEIVHGQLDASLRLADLAAVAGLSVFHFARAFRATVGVAPHRYVVDARVDEARRLILAGATAADAATRVGFHSQGHLTRHMKRLIGVTPGMLARRRGV